MGAGAGDFSTSPVSSRRPSLVVDACRMLAYAILLVVLQLLLLVILSTHPGCPGAFISRAHMSVLSSSRSRARPGAGAK